MRALGYTKAHSLDQFNIQEVEVEKPKIKETDLLVQIRAISVNPVDTKIRQRKSSDDSSPIILGWDASGIVLEVGADVVDFKVGDEVYYAGELNRAGSNAELQAVDQRLVAKKPKNISFTEAAAMPLTSVTAWEALIENKSLELNSRPTILIIGGAGGVGSMAIQILKAKSNAIVIATASRIETINWCKELGADFVINHANDLKTELQKININEVDAVFSTTHTSDYLPKLNEIIRPFGNFILIDDPENLNVAHFKQKSIKTTWEFMFSKSMFNYHPEEQGKVLSEIALLVESGKIKSTLKQTLEGLTTANLKKAHETLESSKSFGKIVLNVN
jgi:zinc-binding alcohol dehydrogenase family protein